MNGKIDAIENDWSGNTGYYLDDQGNRLTVGVEDQKSFLQDAAQAGRKVEKIPTRKYVDRAGAEYNVPEDRLHDFFYDMAGHGVGGKTLKPGVDYAEVREWEGPKGSMPIAMWNEGAAEREQLRKDGWREVGEKNDDGSYTGMDFVNATKHALTHAEDWGVTRDPVTGRIEWGDSAAEIGERLGRGVVGATAGVALGAGEMVADAVVNAGMLASRAPGLDYLVGGDEGRAKFREGYEGVKQSLDDAIVNRVLGDTITQGTRLGEDLAKGGLGAAKTYGEMGIGLKAIGKAGKLAVPAAFGIGGAEGQLEDPTLSVDNLTKDGTDETTAEAKRVAVATAKGLGDAFAGTILGKITHAFGARGASRQMQKSFGKALAIALGESVEGGVAMGIMDQTGEGYREMLGVDDGKTADERVASGLNAMLHGTVMTLGLKAAELSPRLFYSGRGMTKAVSYDVEQLRKSYAPQVAKVAEAARAMQQSGMGLPKGGAFKDVKNVSTNGEVWFADGSCYYPEVAERMVVQRGEGAAAQDKVTTVPGRSARIVVSDGTILDTQGNVIGKTAAGARLDRTVNTQTEAYAQLTDPTAAQTVTVFDRKTGRAAELPDNIMDLAPKGYKPGAEDVDSIAFEEIVGRIKMGGDAMHAAQMALGDIKAGVRGYTEAAELLRQAEAQVSGVVELRADAERASGSRVPVEGSVVVKPAAAKENGELPKTVVDAAMDIQELGKLGEIKPETVDLSTVEETEGKRTSASEPAVDANGEHAPAVFWLNPETNKLEPVDGRKRIAAAKESGAKTVDAVVLRQEDGWTKDTVQAVADVANITSGNMGAKEMVEAFGRLGLDEATAREKGLIATVQMPAGGFDQASLNAALANGKRMAARNIAEFGDAELKAAVTDKNLMALNQIVVYLNARNFGEGWEQAQRAAMYELAEMAVDPRSRALQLVEKMSSYAGKEIGWRDMMEVAKYYGEHYDELKAEGISVKGMPGYELVAKRMVEDKTAAVPVLTPEGEIKTVDEITSARDRATDLLPDGVSAEPSAADNAPGLRLEAFPDVAADGKPNGETVFKCARFKGLEVRIVEGNAELRGMTAEEMLDPRNMYDMAKVVGQLGETLSAAGKRFRVQAGTEAAIEVLLEYYDSSIKTSAADVARGDAVMELMLKSGLAKGVVVDQQQFDQALMGMRGGRELVADGLTYGWTDGDRVFLNPKFFGTKAGLNTKVHEFGHLAWTKVKEVNPELWRRGMELAGQMTEALDALRQEKGYDQYTEEKLREELIVKLIGDRGEMIEASVPKKIMAEVKQWISEVWQSFGAQFGIADLDAAKVRDMTMAEVADAVRAEMLSGRKFGEMRVGDAKAKRAEQIAMAEKPSKENGEIARDAKPVENVAEAAATGDTTVESADGARFSIKSLRWDLKNSSMIADLVSKGIFDANGAHLFKKNLTKLADKLEKLIDKDIRRQFLLDVGEDYDRGSSGKDLRPYNPFKPNSDPLYKISLDFSTLCKKRVLTQFVIEKLQMKLFDEAKKTGKDFKYMSAEHQMAIRDMLLEYQKQDKALQVACHLCYVEAARLKAPKQINRYLADPERVLRAYFAKKNKAFDANVKELQDRMKVTGKAETDDGKKFKLSKKYESGTPKTEMSSADATKLNEYSMLVRQGYTPSAAEQKIIDAGTRLEASNYLTADNLTKLSRTNPEVFEAYTNFVRESTHSKSLETDVPFYYGDAEAVQGLVKSMNEQGTGLRHQSWSDFQMRHLLDTIVAISDLSVRGAKMHAYTKVEDFARIFGRTGLAINLSLIPNVDGKGFDPNEGMDFAKAKALREAFPETCGTIAISISDAHLKELLNNPAIDYVIPYHVSGLNKQLRKMVGIDRWKDATKDQHEKLRSSWDAKTGKYTKAAKDKDGIPKLKEWLWDTRDKTGLDGYELMQAGAERYVELCNQNGIVPKFAGVEGLLGKYDHGKKKGQFFVKEPGYWKLLIDHKMVNQKTGKIIEQQAVRPDFDFKEINKIVDREVKDFKPEQMDEAYNYVAERLPELSERTAKLKKEGAYNKLIADVNSKIDDPTAMLNRPRVEVVSGRRRVANDEGMGERTPGAVAASIELNYQAPTPVQQLGQMRKMSLPLSELEWLRQRLTGGSMPATVARNLPGGAASASTRAGKLVIAADVFGIVDKTDMAREKARLVAAGFFRHEDPTWLMSASVADVRRERMRSDNQLADELERLADRRTSGAAVGGESAARGVFADELANIVMEMPHVPAGTGLGRVRTIGDGLRRALLNGAGGNFDAIRDEAGAFLDWAYGAPAAGTPATRDLPAERLTNRMFGSFLTMPTEMEARAPRWCAEIRNAICSDQRLLAAFRELSVRAASEQSHEALMGQIAKGLDRQTEITIRQLEDQGQEPIEPKGWWTRTKEAMFVAFDDKMAPVATRISENVKLYRQAKMAAIKAATTPAEKARLTSELGRFEGRMGQLVDKMEMSRLAMERGTNNEGRRYFMQELMLVNEATERQGLTLEDMCLYLDMKRGIETQGRANSYGMTPRQNQLALNTLQMRLGPEKWHALEVFAQKWWGIHDAEFVSDPRLRTAFGDKFVDYLETQSHYVTTSRTWTPEQLADIEAQRTAARRAGVNGGDDVIDQMYAFGARAGMGSSEGLISAKLSGSFAAKKNVMAATWEKIDRAQRFLRRNQYVIDMRDALLAAKVEGVRDVARGQTEIKENGRYGVLNYMQDGQKRALIVPRQIADGFKTDPAALKWYTTLRGMWRAAIIDYNPAYWNRNIGRNSGSIEKNMPGMKESWVKTALRPLGLGNIVDTCCQHLVRHFASDGSTVAKLFGEDTIYGFIPKARRMATLLENPSEWQRKLWAADDAGDIETVATMRADLSETMTMLKGNMLLSGSAKRRGESAGFVNDVLGSKGLKTIKQIEAEYAAKGKLRKAVDALNIFARNARQQVFEDDLAKITAYLHDRVRFAAERTPEESAKLVAENVSIAQGERRGVLKVGIQGTLAPFFNMVEKGIVRNVKAHLDRPGEMVAKDAKVVAGTVLGTLIYTGTLSQVIRKMFDDDDEKIKASPYAKAYDFLEFCRRSRKNYSQYVADNFNCMPVWTSPSGRTTIVIGMPYNDEDKLLTPMAQAMGMAIARKAGMPVEADWADAALRSTIGGITPDLAVAAPWYTFLRDTVQGIFMDNPQDYYTKSTVYDQKLHAVKGESLEAAGDFAWAVGMRLWNDLGGRGVMQFDRAGVEGQGEESEYVDVALRKLPVLSPVIRSFIKIQTGDIEKYSKPLTEAEAQRRKILGYLADKAAKKSTEKSFWSWTDPQGFDSWVAAETKTYGLSPEEVELLREKITQDWLEQGPMKPTKDVEKRMDVMMKSVRRGIDPRTILD